jgi:hypothetical protein
VGSNPTTSAINIRIPRRLNSVFFLRFFCVSFFEIYFMIPGDYNKKIIITLLFAMSLIVFGLIVIASNTYFRGRQSLVVGQF